MMNLLIILFSLVHCTLWKLSDLIFRCINTCNSHNSSIAKDLLFVIDVKFVFVLQVLIFFCHLFVLGSPFRMQCGVEVYFSSQFNPPIRDRFSSHIVGSWFVFSVWCLICKVLQLENYSL